jgi:hypothetical protein
MINHQNFNKGKSQPLSNHISNYQTRWNYHFEFNSKWNKVIMDMYYGLWNACQFKPSFPLWRLDEQSHESIVQWLDYFLMNDQKHII